VTDNTNVVRLGKEPEHGSPEVAAVAAMLARCIKQLGDTQQLVIAGMRADGTVWQAGVCNRSVGLLLTENIRCMVWED